MGTARFNKLPPALRCMLILLRPYLANANICRSAGRDPWQLRFTVDNAGTGPCRFAMRLGHDDAIVSNVTRVVMEWQAETYHGGLWYETASPEFMALKQALIGALTRSRAERRWLSAMLDEAWNYSDPDALCTVLPWVGEVRTWASREPYAAAW